MTTLKGKKILLAISGGIAIKNNYTVRDFLKNGADGWSPSAEISSQKLPFLRYLKTLFFLIFYDENGIWNSHVELGLWADVLVIAPCTANTLSKNGSRDL